MARGRPPLFLQPEPYRQRRLIDAARLLPVFGTFLFVVPMLLLPRGESGTTVQVMVYIFLLWALLILFTALIARYIRRAEASRRGAGPFDRVAARGSAQAEEGDAP